MAFRRFLGAGFSFAIASLILSGCASIADQSADTATSLPSTPVTETVTQTVQAPPPSQVDSPTSQPDTPPPQCSQDPNQSEFGQYLALSRAPVGELGDTAASVIPVDGWFYHFQVGENGYDSCAPLSYLVLNGSNGDAERSAGTGAAIADVMVLFVNGELVTQPAPFEIKRVESVTRLSDSEIQVVYGHAGRSTAEGITEYYTFNFFLDNGQLSGRGGLPPHIDSHMRLYLLG